MKQLARWRQFGGWWTRYAHDARSTKCEMTFSVFVPDGATAAPTLYYLSGLTCTDENFVHKAGAARQASSRGVALVVPDTSPRGNGLAGEDDAYDFGTGAGFYVDALQEPWASAGYKMESYVATELRDLVDGLEGVDADNAGLTGHSMGGHGALTLAFKYPDRYASVSALAPICNPTRCPWGVKAFEGYLGSVDAGEDHDACKLVAKHETGRFDSILVDQGAEDQFLVGDIDQLRPESFRAACDKAGQNLNLRYHPGFDHSYFFISTFIDDHVDFAADRLLNNNNKKHAAS
ncbi:hypothetical protein CTAYLR_008392 [Chrysophaeum taylorii]|uniref:S-formylglutathione hydrolase n=1 Tax=Chrysophaeum taylorii TaxID=2483200 RepID=A0AAD7UJB3_9STRA|nr:hypothetical protein CTAYLR_008392 [Chrysophaeum taylorii]